MEGFQLVNRRLDISIGFPPVSDVADFDDSLLIIDVVDDPVISNPHPPKA
jgi:hypothetical protein